MKKYLFSILIFFSFFLVNKSFADTIPDVPANPKLVVDLGNTGFLSPNEMQELEYKLERFSDSTSNQIAVVFVKDLQGDDPSDFADRLAIKWKIGQKGLDNGILIMVKPKTLDSKGEVEIRIGKGLEGLIPDLKAYEIINREILPEFKQGNFSAGLNKGVNVLMSLAKKEYSFSDYQKKNKQSANKYGGFIVFIVIGIVFLLMRIKGGNATTYGTTGSSLPFWATMFFLGSMGGGRDSSGHWDDFSSGGGDFGGFGGGDFGGGGAGGSW